MDFIPLAPLVDGVHLSPERERMLVITVLLLKAPISVLVMVVLEAVVQFPPPAMVDLEEVVPITFIWDQGPAATVVYLGIRLPNATRKSMLQRAKFVATVEKLDIGFKAVITSQIQCEQARQLQGWLLSFQVQLPVLE